MNDGLNFLSIALLILLGFFFGLGVGISHGQWKEAKTAYELHRQYGASEADAVLWMVKRGYRENRIATAMKLYSAD